MTGSIQAKHGKYYIIIRIEDVVGRRKQKWISTGLDATPENREKAERILEEMDFHEDVNDFLFNRNMAFKDWILYWLNLKKEQVRMNTYEAYYLYATQHIIPFFSSKKITICSITPIQIQAYYNEKKNVLSGNSLVKHHVIIRGALNEAVRMDLIKYNPADKVTLPKKTKFVGSAYSQEESSRLLDIIRGESIEPAVILGLFYGLRRSEAVGLRWKDIDFDNGIMRIQNTVVKTKTLIEHEETKSKASKRLLALVPSTIPYLEQLKLQQDAHKELLGDSYHDTGHVCVWPNGEMLSPDYVSKRFQRLLEKNNMPKIRFHDLRHTVASLMLNKGVSPKRIQEYLGHEKVITTLDIYGHLCFEGKQETANLVDDLFCC